MTRTATCLTLAAMSLGFSIVQLDVTIVNTALASISASLHGGIAELQWVVSAYTIAFAALILTAGAIGDHYGAKRVFLGGFSLFTLASIGCAAAPTAALLIAARAAQGIGAAILVPNSLALLNHAYPDASARGRAVGIWAAGASFALTAGPLVAGVLIVTAGWRSIFLINVPIGLAGLWLTARYAGETPAAQSRALDLPGQAAAIGALGALAGSLIEAGVLGWTAAPVLAGFGVAALLGGLFLLREWRTSAPMLPLGLFRQAGFTPLIGVGLFVNIAFYGLIFVMSLYFQEARHLTAFSTGLCFMPTMGAVLVTNLSASRIVGRLGATRTIALGAAAAGLGCIGLVGLDSAAPYWTIGVQLAALGGGLGLLVPPLTASLLGSVNRSRSGLVAGILNSTRQTGSVLGVALFGSLVAQAGGLVSGMRLAMAISAALFAVAVAAALLGARHAVR